jgi:hypothetical protein
MFDHSSIPRNSGVSQFGFVGFLDGDKLVHRKGQTAIAEI